MVWTLSTLLPEPPEVANLPASEPMPRRHNYSTGVNSTGRATTNRGNTAARASADSHADFRIDARANLIASIEIKLLKY